MQKMLDQHLKINVSHYDDRINIDLHLKITVLPGEK